MSDWIVGCARLQIDMAFNRKLLYSAIFLIFINCDIDRACIILIIDLNSPVQLKRNPRHLTVDFGPALHVVSIGILHCLCMHRNFSILSFTILPNLLHRTWKCPRFQPIFIINKRLQLKINGVLLL